MMMGAKMYPTVLKSRGEISSYWTARARHSSKSKDASMHVGPLVTPLALVLSIVSLLDGGGTMM